MARRLRPDQRLTYTYYVSLFDDTVDDHHHHNHCCCDDHHDDRCDHDDDRCDDHDDDRPGGHHDDDVDQRSARRHAVVSDDTPAPGERITFSASGFSGSSTSSATLLSDPVSLGAVQSDATGAVRALDTIPVDTTPGRHQIVVSGPNPGGGVHRAVADIMVLPGGRSGTLPVTGSDDVGRSVTIGLLLAVVGAGAAWWGRSTEEA